MQTLHFDGKDKNGKKIKVPTEVLRSWIDSSGKSIFLLSSGLYCTKNGEIVSSLENLDILKAEEVIGEHPSGKPKMRFVESAQYTQAKRWWETVGKAKSEEFYKLKNQHLQALQQEGVPELEEGATVYDVMYSRQPSGSRGRAGLVGPEMFGEWFTDIPPWWGHADMIDIGGYRYKKDQAEQEFEEVVNG